MVMVATFKRDSSCTRLASGLANSRRFLDAPSEHDFADAQRIAKSIESLRLHNRRHAKLGHGFQFTTIDRDSIKIRRSSGHTIKSILVRLLQPPMGLACCENTKLRVSWGAQSTAPLRHGHRDSRPRRSDRVFREILAQLGSFLAGR